MTYLSVKFTREELVDADETKEVGRMARALIDCDSLLVENTQLLRRNILNKDILSPSWISKPRTMFYIQCWEGIFCQW